MYGSTVLVYAVPRKVSLRWRSQREESFEKMVRSLWVFILQFIFLIEIQRHEIAEPNAEHYRLDGRYLHPATAFFLTDKTSNLQVIRDEIERYYLDPKTPVVYGTLSTYD